MTRLVDLAPEWILYGERIVGLRFDCACCQGSGFSVGILFANPPDGGPPLRQDSRHAYCHSGIRYRRHGETFEDLTVQGIILSSRAHHWAGHIDRGEVSP